MDWLDSPKGQSEFSAHTALIESGIRTEEKVTNQDIRQCHIALRRIGYEPDKNKTRIGKSRVRFWRKPQQIKSNN